MLPWTIIPIIICVLYKFTNNLVNWISTLRYEKLYENYCALYSKDADAKRAKKGEFSDKEIKIAKKLDECKFQIISLFKKSGLKSFLMTITVPTGDGYEQHQQLDLFENLRMMATVGNINIPHTIQTLFRNAAGIYKSRCIESFNPLFWINSVLFLPRSIVAYLGYPIESKKISLIVNTANILYWTFIVVTYFLTKILHVTIMIR